MTISHYNITVNYQNKILLYNTISKNYVCIEKDDTYDTLANFYNSPLSKKMGFVHDDDYDEKSAFLMKQQDFYENRILNLTIIPTMQCNFACSYCYETRQKKVMSLETIESIKRFLELHLHEYSGLTINWFGGEPLLCVDIIKEINTKAKFVSQKLGKVFMSSITTNGYLLTSETFCELCNLNIRNYTVTIDGLKDSHDKYRKLFNGKGTYDTIINNLVNISNINEHFNFTIRMNVNKNNYGEFDSFINLMHKFFGSDKRFDLSFALVSDWGGNSIHNMKNDLLDSTTIIIEAAKKHKQEFAFKSLFYTIEGNTCNFKNRNSYVIDTEGNLLKCTIYLDHNNVVVGKILSNGQLYYNYSNLSYWNLHDSSIKKCPDCKMSLICRGRLCPATDNYSSKCTCSLEKLERMVIAKYELNPQDFYYINNINFEKTGE